MRNWKLKWPLSPHVACLGFPHLKSLGHGTHRAIVHSGYDCWLNEEPSLLRGARWVVSLSWTPSMHKALEIMIDCECWYTAAHTYTDWLAGSQSWRSNDYSIKVFQKGLYWAQLPDSVASQNSRMIASWVPADLHWVSNFIQGSVRRKSKCWKLICNLRVISRILTREANPSWWIGSTWRTTVNK